MYISGEGGLPKNDIYMQHVKNVDTVLLSLYINSFEICNTSRVHLHLIYDVICETVAYWETNSVISCFHKWVVVIMINIAQESTKVFSVDTLEDEIT